mmetsp:Transcript_42456/g.106107  ORF Transcript_42456/g.106107 Transcript_42456/m.106107 type:complete len:235 (-) Transcript_42456:220-924(-)
MSLPGRQTEVMDLLFSRRPATTHAPEGPMRMLARLSIGQLQSVRTELEKRTDWTVSDSPKMHSHSIDACHTSRSWVMRISSCAWSHTAFQGKSSTPLLSLKTSEPSRMSSMGVTLMCSRTPSQDPLTTCSTATECLSTACFLKSMACSMLCFICSSSRYHSSRCCPKSTNRLSNSSRMSFSTPPSDMTCACDPSRAASFSRSSFFVSSSICSMVHTWRCFLLSRRPCTASMAGV